VHTQVDAMRRARTIIVPTNDLTVRQRLRELSHPITLFGELAPGRRERLRTIMAAEVAH
jgi:U4/U6 small nuclear ribonucleoprotein PRP4